METEELIAERQKSYGDPVLAHARIALVWSGILDMDVTAHQVAQCMIGVKLVRAANDPDNPDNQADIKGYSHIAELIMEGGGAG